jgi:hypothetical protein
MAHETVNHQNRIVRDPEIMVGKSLPNQPVHPRDFYAEVAKRPEVADLLRRLAR